MKFNATTPNLTYETIKAKLDTQFPDYTSKMRGKQFLIVKKSSTVGANVLMRKEKIIVGGNFPTMAGTLIFTLLMVLGGILIPLIIYFIVFHKKFKAIENEVGNFLKAEFGKQEVV